MFEVATSLNIDLFTNIITYEGKELWVQSLILSGLLIKLGAAPFHQ